MQNEWRHTSQTSQQQQRGAPPLMLGLNEEKNMNDFLFSSLYNEFLGCHLQFIVNNGNGSKIIPVFYLKSHYDENYIYIFDMLLWHFSDD